MLDARIHVSSSLDVIFAATVIVQTAFSNK